MHPQRGGFGRRSLLAPVFVALALLPLRVARAEVIHSFAAALRLRPDSTLDVIETIDYDFESAERHGIYRMIPVVYDRHGGTYKIYLHVVSVTDGDGNRLSYTDSQQGRERNIRIGDPDRTVTGRHVYRLRYELRRAVNFFSGAPEVYWNVTGNDWPVGVERVAATLSLPAGLPLDQVKTACFVGPPGSTQAGQVTVEPSSLLFAGGPLQAGEGLTLLAGLPPGYVHPPSLAQSIAWFLADWWPALLFPLLALAGVLPQWWFKGRDVDGGQAVAVEWNPPKDLTPAEVGTLVDERCDMADIVSTLVDLAARGYLTIQEIQTEGFLFLSHRDYIFTRKPAPAATTPLLPHEQKFLDGLFGASGGQVALSSLKDHFYTQLPGIRSAIYQSLMDKRLFTQNPDTVRSQYTGCGVGLLVVGVIAAFALYSLDYAVGLGIAGAIVLASARAMPAKTAKGSRLLRECLGFQRFVKLAEKDRIAVLAKDDPTIFGRLLPYAMVLGVADQWANAFRDLLHEPPDWYVPYGNNYMFSSNVFVHDLGSGMNTMGNTFASAPSQAGSGGSGFSSGGGFSGGGFGGGGGGSW